MMGLGKGDSFQIWPFVVSMLDFWCVMLILGIHGFSCRLCGALAAIVPQEYLSRPQSSTWVAP